MLRGQMQFCSLKYQQFSEILTIIVEANRNTNPVLVNKYQSIERFEQETKTFIQTCFNSEKLYQQILNKPIKYNYGIRINGKLVAVILSLDLIEQYKFLMPLLDDPTHTAHQFACEILKTDIKQQAGTVIYFTRLSVLPQMMGKGIGKRLVYETSKQLSNWGYQYAIEVAKVKASFELFTKLGGQIISVAEAVRPTFTYQIIIIKNNFKKLMEIVEESYRVTQK